jgi:hypothetical protein
VAGKSEQRFVALEQHGLSAIQIGWLRHPARGDPFRSLFASTEHAAFEAKSGKPWQRVSDDECLPRNSTSNVMSQARNRNVTTLAADPLLT